MTSGGTPTGPQHDRDANPVVKLLLRFLLKLSWTRGGDSDIVDGLPRVTGEDFSPYITELQPGDALLLGNNGSLSHVALHVGDGAIVHSMATQHTMRGTWGSMLDALARVPRWVLGIRDVTGVLKEPLVDFLDRFERDSWVVLRRPGLDPSQIELGVAHVHTLVGRAYDYDFSVGDDEYYCTEIILEFLQVALGRSVLGDVPGTEVHVPGLISRTTFEPMALWSGGVMGAVLANTAACTQHADALEGVRVV